MRENALEFKMELGINAQKIVAQFQENNRALESSLENGIKKALEELQEENHLEFLIKEQTKKEILNFVSGHTFTWELQKQIKQKVSEKVEEKLNAYADKIAEQITKSLK
jgi:hypothetical protein